MQASDDTNPDIVYLHLKCKDRVPGYPESKEAGLQLVRENIETGSESRRPERSNGPDGARSTEGGDQGQVSHTE